MNRPINLRTWIKKTMENLIPIFIFHSYSPLRIWWKSFKWIPNNSMAYLQPSSRRATSKWAYEMRIRFFSISERSLYNTKWFFIDQWKILFTYVVHFLVKHYSLFRKTKKNNWVNTKESPVLVTFYFIESIFWWS
jgi:hypothetical protein